jgi:RNA polymerase sigma factor (sigma-70 family)
VEDRAIVAALVSGDPRGMEGAYRAYADRLYTYCRGMLRDADAAADAVHDTFILAGQRAGQLRDPERLRSWLYAIARNECLRFLRRRGRHVPLEEAGQVSAPDIDPVADLQAADVQELVWAAAAGLNPGDREVFELAVRHELAAPEVSAALGVSVAHAHARLSRARAQLERALGALLVARTGQEDCPELAELLSGWDGMLTALLRKRISRHIESCDTCGERRRRQLSPAALFSAYAGLPMLVAPAELWPRLQLTSGDGAYAEALVARAGRWDPVTGFPVPLEAQRRRTAVAGVAAVAVAAMLAFGGGFLAGAVGPQEPALTAPPSEPAGGSASPSAPVTAPPTSTPTTPPPEPTPTASPTPSPTPTERPFAVDATAQPEDCVPRTWVATVAAVANRPVEEAVVMVTVGSVQRTYEMVVVGNTATAQIQHPVPEGERVVWWVEATAVDGARAETEPVPACE